MSSAEKPENPKPNRAGVPSFASRRPRSIKKLTDAALEAAGYVGNELKKDKQVSREGLVGYLAWVAREHPKAFMPLLAKVIPTQINTSLGGQLRIIDSTLSPQQAAEAYAATLQNIPGVLEPLSIDPSLIDAEFEEVETEGNA